MQRLVLGVAAFFLLLSAVPALAQDREYCPTRPSLGTTPCTIERGHVSVETAVTDWTLDNQSDQRTDTVLVGDTRVRIGLTDAVELQFGWTPYGHVRTRDKIQPSVEQAGRIGDAILGFKANVLNPDGTGVSVAVRPYFQMPVGRAPVGAGDWGGGVVVPVTVDLNKTLTLALTSEVDAAVNRDGPGRHLAYSQVAGLEIKLSHAVKATLDSQLLRDEDPLDKTTQAFASASLAWMARDTLQFDIGTVVGLNRAAPDVALYLGVSRLF